jgi:acetoacetyl-CoA synthetase
MATEQAHDEAFPPWQWQPDAQAGVLRYAQWLEERGLGAFRDYPSLWRWSTAHVEQFWWSLWEYFQIDASTQPTSILAGGVMPDTTWFSGAQLNYTAQIFRNANTLGDYRGMQPAIIEVSQALEPRELTYDELRDEVGRVALGLQRLGVSAGDRVAGYLPNSIEAVVAFLAAASIGAIWASCSPDYGVAAVTDRFAQIGPRVLIAVGGYRYGDKQIDKVADVQAIVAELPSLRAVVTVGDALPLTWPRTTSWSELRSVPAAAEPFVDVPFEHPLYILYSSGTTGLPKAIVHGHGGIVLEHLKLHALAMDTRAGDRVAWLTTTAWTMWNILVSGLLCRATIVLFDGNPLWPDAAVPWMLAEKFDLSLLGLSPGVLDEQRRLSMGPYDGSALPKLRTLGVTGAPMTEETARWLTKELGPVARLNSMSGGTDVCTALVSGNPWLPVIGAEISGPCLGVSVTAFDDSGQPVRGDVGELVVTAPMPSMPICFWGDTGGSRLRAAYFDRYPGVWCHGDWVRFTDSGSCVILGRSDSTLNRGGVRLGTGEFYRIVERLPRVVESLVVHLEEPGGKGLLILYVVLVPGCELDDEFRAAIRDALRSQLSPRHVPDQIIRIGAVPRTLTGKKLEVPVKRILQGAPPDSVLNRAALADPRSIAYFESAASQAGSP